MKFTKEIVETINNFIIDNIPAHQHDILAVVMEHFGLSKPTAVKYLNGLLDKGVIQKERKGRYPNYQLVNTVFDYTYKLNSVFDYTYKVDNTLDEDAIWRKDISPHLEGIAPNVRQICQYGFTEMVNNVIEHSGSDKLKITLTINARVINFDINDWGIGIFNKIKEDLGLEDPKHSILELAKGKFTSDPSKHSGEGIFFTSRVFDGFLISSGNLMFSGHKNDDRLVELPTEKAFDGTWVYMTIRRNSSLQISDVFNEYTDPDKQPSFHKTAIPVKLMQYEGESLMSRSQAKRFITRFDRFLEVVLDFTGVDMIGQGFADEIFRVFANANPTVHLKPINCSENVQNMILHVGGKLE
ncbi:histidine kinase [Spirochaetia bacterium]|nr:histidine kinase [Spirochaetia bacterium]